MIFRKRAPLLLTPTESDKLREQPVCVHCQGWHAMACPRVRRMVFNASGAIAEVEFWAWRDWPKDAVIFPDEIEAMPAQEG